MRTAIRLVEGQGTEIRTFMTLTEERTFMKNNRNSIITVAPTELLQHKINPREFMLAHDLHDGTFLTYDLGKPINPTCLWAQLYTINEPSGEKFIVPFKKTKSGIKVMYGGEWFKAKEREKIPR